MADNYIEKKMEELRSGKLSRPARHATGSRKGFIQYPFPEKRVLVIGGANGVGLMIVKEYLRAGCRVAVFDSDKAKGDDLAFTQGIRFHLTDIEDAGSTASQFHNLLKAWRDIDIIVCTSPEKTSTIAMEWDKHKQRFPIPSDYPGRLITIGFADDSAKSLLGNRGIIVSSISCQHNDGSFNPEIARGCIFLSLPPTSHPCCLTIG